MDRLGLDDILDLDAYERIRDGYRPRIIAHKKARRVAVGPQVSLVFEDRETLRYQIQEMTRVERIRQPAKVQAELDVYNELMPGENELSATLFIEIPELDQIQPALDRLVGIDEHVGLVVTGTDSTPERIGARFDDRQMEEDRISAVHYIRFALTATQARSFREGAPPKLRIDHPRYRHETELTTTTRESLAADLAGRPPVLLDTSAAARPGPNAPQPLLETERVRAVRLSPEGASARIVVEPRDPTVSFANAAPELLGELLHLAQRLATEVAERAGDARLSVDWHAKDDGPPRIEITERS